MAKVEFVPAERWHMEAVARGMREECAMECRAAGREPLEALLEGAELDDLTYCCLIDGVPAFVFGGRTDAFGECGRIWGLSSRVCDAHPREVVEYGRKAVEVFLDWCPRWIAWSYEGCVRSHRWMRAIGFEIGDEPCGEFGNGDFLKAVLERRV